ncbi:aspartyl protease family protein [Nonomuraea sp. NPDC050404]|uniref:aspartyl protease family protein n=1 Tax=Nonomuraea sp. NPDC050404 TaxID=3155783 RepID=UPI0033F8FF9F
MYEDIGRRAFLRRAGVATAAGVALPALGVGLNGAAASITSDGDADQLFKAGKFDQADRTYARQLRQNPDDAHAMAQRGYIALLINRFGAAERFLAGAVKLDAGDVASKQRLAECYVRQDQHARAVPLLRQTGRKSDAALAEWYSHLSGTPWQVHGTQETRVPMTGLEPLPTVTASINGSSPKRFLLDTYATLSLSEETATEAGLKAVASLPGHVGHDPVTQYLGLLPSFRLGNVELRNLPVQWTTGVKMPNLPDGTQPAGVLGTTVFYHFLTTMDYPGKALVLRRRTEAQLRQFRAQAARTAFDRLPLWLAGDHFPFTLGSLREYGPRFVSLDTGGLGQGFSTTVDIAERAGIQVDYDKPQGPEGSGRYAATAEKISLGRAVGHDIPGWAGPGGPGPGQSETLGFDSIANVSHVFCKPFALTFDYTHMHLYITGESL